MMKRSDIRNAYDRMSPTPEQKQNIYQEILKANRRQGNVRQNHVRQRVIRRWSWIPAAVALMFVAVTGVFVLGREISLNPAIEATQPIETTEQLSAYDTLLEVYRTAVREGWSEEECQKNGISPQFADVKSSEEKPAYVILDIDGNGVSELIIGQGMPHYFYVWDLYAFDHDGQPVKLHTDTKNHINCHLYENAIIGTEYVSKTDASFSYFRLEGATLLSLDILTCKNDFWYDEIAKQQISKENADDTLSKYELLDVEPVDLMANVDHELADIEAAEQYNLILEKYRTALTESWSWEQCDEADISRQIMFDWVKKNDLGWFLLDIDENGAEELIISDGTHLFDLYTIRNGQPIHLLRAHPDHYTLCKDSTIEQRQHQNEVNTYWRWYHLSGSELIPENVVYLEAKTHQYYYGTDDKSMEKVSEDEAGKYLVNSEKTAMEWNLVPFVEKEYPDVREPNYYYESIIETYRTAIEEHWDPGKCMENGISLMVGYYGGIVPELGHNQIDLNGDGNGELIITDGTDIYDLYTIVSDEEVGPLRLIEATERNRYFLTTDGYIYNMASGSAMLSYYYLFNVGQRQLELVKGYQFDASVNPDNPWSYYDGKSEAVLISTEDAAAAMDAIHFEEIAFIPFG